MEENFLDFRMFFDIPFSNGNYIENFFFKIWLGTVCKWKYYKFLLLGKLRMSLKVVVTKIPFLCIQDYNAFVEKLESSFAQDDVFLTGYREKSMILLSKW